MSSNRRRFLQHGLAVATASTVAPSKAGTPLDPAVQNEMRSRLKYLSPPDGIPAFGASPSPVVEPFKDPLFVPPIAPALIEMSSPAERALSDAEWWTAFSAAFEDKAKQLRAHGVDIGSLPVPEAHQRFYEIRPWRFYVLREREFLTRYHSDYGNQCWSWGYEAIGLNPDGTPSFTPGKVDGGFGSSPGPTFHTRYGEPILCRRINGLPEIGSSPGSANLRFALPSTASHLHNAHTASESDGFPGDWINPGEYWDHQYGNFPSGHDDREKLTSLWYHDHRMDFTASNVYAGLDGFYFLFDDQDTGDDATGWNLPSGAYDVPLILHDLAFAKDATGTPQLVFDGFMTDGVLGDRYTVNRVIQPNLKVEPRKYRLRILNGGPSRFYELVLWDERAKLDHPFIVITGDGNFQPNPLIADSLYFGVAQRVDVIVDFSGHKPGDLLYFVNELLQLNGRGPTETHVKPDPADMNGYLKANAVMRFEVIAPAGEDKSGFPLVFRDLPKVDLTEVRRERLWVFDYQGGLWTINGQIFDPNRIDAGIEQDSAEIWTFRNNGNGWHHPIHSHFTEFIVLEINGVPQYQARVQIGEASKSVDFQSVFSNAARLRRHFSTLLNPGAPGAPATAAASAPMSAAAVRAFEALPAEVQNMVRQGRFAELRFGSYAAYKTWAEVFRTLDLGNVMVDRFMGGPRRDVALLLPNWEVKVFMRWKDFLGKHVMHCHNVVHEDHAMMVRWEIVPQGRGFDTPKRVGEVAQLGHAVRQRPVRRVEDVPAQASAASSDE